MFNKNTRNKSNESKIKAAAVHLSKSTSSNCSQDLEMVEIDCNKNIWNYKNAFYTSNGIEVIRIKNITIAARIVGRFSIWLNGAH